MPRLEVFWIRKASKGAMCLQVEWISFQKRRIHHYLRRWHYGFFRYRQRSELCCGVLERIVRCSRVWQRELVSWSSAGFREQTRSRRPIVYVPATIYREHPSRIWDGQCKANFNLDDWIFWDGCQYGGRQDLCGHKAVRTEGWFPVVLGSPDKTGYFDKLSDSCAIPEQPDCKLSSGIEEDFPVRTRYFKIWNEIHTWNPATRWFRTFRLCRRHVRQKITIWLFHQVKRSYVHMGIEEASDCGSLNMRSWVPYNELGSKGDDLGEACAGRMWICSWLHAPSQLRELVCNWLVDKQALRMKWSKAHQRSGAFRTWESQKRRYCDELCTGRRQWRQLVDQTIRKNSAWEDMCEHWT